MCCRFPANEDLRMKWVPAMKRDKWIPLKYSYICSEHFNIANYIVPPGQAYTKLRKSAVPSKFNFPSHLMPKEKQSRRPIVYVKPPSNEASSSASKENESFSLKEHSYYKKAKTTKQSPTKARLRK